RRNLRGLGPQRYFDVPAGGLGVGAQLVGALGELLRGVGVLAGDCDFHRYCESKTFTLGADSHVRGDDGVGRVNARRLAGEAKSFLEARGVPSSKKEFGVRRPTRAAEFCRWAHIQVD